MFRDRSAFKLDFRDRLSEEADKPASEASSLLSMADRPREVPLRVPFFLLWLEPVH